MIVERSLLPDFLTNTYLVGDPGGAAFFVDAGGPVAPLIEAAEREGMTPTHVLLTHHHYDHVVALARAARALAGHGGADPSGRARPGRRRDRRPDPRRGAADRRRPTSRCCTRPGTRRAWSRCSSTGEVFTGDTLFKGSVGGVRAPGSTSYADLKSSIMDMLADAPAGDRRAARAHGPDDDRRRAGDQRLHARSGAASTPRATAPCTALGEPATLVLLGDDYDGGHKAWVRWPDGRDDIVPGSQVQQG